jgi:DNA invertase Pin-like site-specific DNA recombinase
MTAALLKSEFSVPSPTSPTGTGEGANGIASTNPLTPSLSENYAGESRRIVDAFSRQMVLVIRQSTMLQRRENEGSDAAQRRAGAVVRMFNRKEEEVEVLDMRGESASGIKARPHFQRLLERARRGEIGVILLARADRLSRNDGDSVAIFDAMRQHGGVIVVDGRVYDPNNPSDELMLQIQATFAQYDQRMRTRWFMATRLGLAQQLRYRRQLPSGLCWASPSDPLYRSLAAQSGTDSWLHSLRDNPSTYRAWCKFRDTPHYPLPYPDADVYRTVVLRTQWFNETGSISAVYRRIRTDPAWPANRHGMVPLTSQRPFSSDSRVEWVRVNKHSLRSWLLSPALYGIYTFTPGRTGREQRENLSAATATIFESNAFPSLLPSERYSVLREALVGAPRPRLARANSVEPTHLLRNLRCGAVLPDGSLCGERLHAIQRTRSAQFRYQSNRCGERHGYQPNIEPTMVDGTVLDLLAELMTDASVGAAVEQVHLSGKTLSAEAERLRTDLSRIRAEYTIARDMEKDARRRDDRLGTQAAVEDQERFAAQWKEIEARLDRVGGDEERLRALAEKDAGRIVSLARRFRELVERARLPHADRGRSTVALRALIATCVQNVFVRRLARSSWQVDVVFPTGAVVRRTLFTDSLAVTAPERAWIAACHQKGMSAAAIATELNNIMRTRRVKGAAWNADRIRAVIARLDSVLASGQELTTVAAVPIHPYLSEPDDTREAALGASRPRRKRGPQPMRLLSIRNYRGAAKAAAAAREVMGGGYSIETLLSLDDLVALVGVPRNDVLRLVLLGRLGPVVPGDGTILLRPSDYQLHGEFPEFARATVAKANAWPVEDTITLAVARQEFSYSVQHRLRLRERQDTLAIARDVRGRMYVRRSVVETCAAEAPSGTVLQNALLHEKPDWQALECRFWRPSHLATREARTSWAALVGVAPVIEVPGGARPKTTGNRATAPLGPNGSPLYAWIGPEVMRTLDRLELTAAVNALGRPDLDPCDFYPRSQLLYHFATKLGGPAPATWSRAVAEGRVIEVAALGVFEGIMGSRRRKKWYANVPRAVYEATQLEDVHAWLRGELPRCSE